GRARGRRRGWHCHCDQACRRADARVVPLTAGSRSRRLPPGRRARARRRRGRRRVRRRARPSRRPAGRARSASAQPRGSDRSTEDITMTLVLAHARAMTLELARHPAYLVPTLAFPAVFFLFFAAPGTNADADVRMATFAGFAALGVAFFQFGVGIAAERASPWEVYLRTLPVGAGTRLAARVLSAAVFAAAAAAVVIAVAVALTPVGLTPRGWVELAAALVAGTAPFALLGVAIGYWAPPRAALPLANLLYLGLAYAGG